MSKEVDLERTAEAQAEERVLDLLIPRPYYENSEEDTSPTREKFRRALREGKLHPSLVEVYDENPDVDSDEPDSIWALPNLKDEDIVSALLNEAIVDWLKSVPSGRSSVKYSDLQARVIQSSRARVFRRTRQKREMITVEEALNRFREEALAAYSIGEAEPEYESSLLLSRHEILAVQDSLLALARERPAFLDEISPRQFEELLQELLLEQGFDVELTATTRDGGCDLIAVSRDQLGIKTKYVVEAKHYSRLNKVGVGQLGNSVQSARDSLLTTDYWSLLHIFHGMQ